MSERVENLVICSTLNQTTNFLMIKKYKPKRIFNITYDEKMQKNMGFTINMSDWDKNLEDVLENPKDGEIKYKVKKEDCVKLKKSHLHSIKKIQEKIEKCIVNIAKGKIYWHVTGGQRIVALAIALLLKDKERIEDRIIYVEGNKEELIINDYTGEDIIDDDDFEDLKYGDQSLTIKTVLNLMGLNTNDMESTFCFKENGKCKKVKEDEKKFYEKLYIIIQEEKEVRDELLNSNSSDYNKKKRCEILNKLFEDLKKKHEGLGDYNIKESKEMDKNYPAGYIFEKIVAYQIYKAIKQSDAIVEMVTSLKTKTKEDNILVDELDILLLTDTGKLLNFECKTGSMTGDNAKSNNYTTYRLAGVFGMPIFMSPLTADEILHDKKDQYKKQSAAVRAAKRAGLKTCGLDEIKTEIKNIFDKIEELRR